MKTLRIVNKSLDTEIQHIVLQDIETNETYEFSQIVGENISNGDISHPVIQQILHNGHTVTAEINEGYVTLYF